MKPRSLAGPPLADLVGALQNPHYIATHGRPYHFRRRTSYNIALSRLRSATSRLSRVFSSSNCFKRRVPTKPRAGELFLPTAERRLRDTELAADLLNQCSNIRLPQGKRDLLVHISFPLQGIPPPRAKNARKYRDHTGPVFGFMTMAADLRPWRRPAGSQLRYLAPAPTVPRAAANDSNLPGVPSVGSRKWVGLVVVRSATPQGDVPTMYTQAAKALDNSTPQPVLLALAVELTE